MCHEASCLPSPLSTKAASTFYFVSFDSSASGMEKGEAETKIARHNWAAAAHTPALGREREAEADL